MRANTCSFNPGVIVANLTEWRNQNISRQLEHWMELNTQYVTHTGEKMGEYEAAFPAKNQDLLRLTLIEQNCNLVHWLCLCWAESVGFLREDLYSKTLAESITTPPLLIVFYKRHSTIDPMWHIRHLGKFCSATDEALVVGQTDFTCGTIKVFSGRSVWYFHLSTILGTWVHTQDLCCTSLFRSFCRTFKGMVQHFPLLPVIMLS